MKRTERHHLKENELAGLTGALRTTVGARKSQVIGGIVALVVLAGGAIGYRSWRGRAEGRVGALLAEAMSVQEARVGQPEAPGSSSPNPSYPTERDRHQAAVEKFKLVADQFPETEQGRYARFREAGAQMALGNAKEAVALYEQVATASADSLYGQMARLGVAEAQARGGEYDKAIAAYKALSDHKDGPLPVDGILMQLGRTYLGAGKASDAQQTFTRLVEEFPESPFVSDAKRELESLKKG